VRLLDTYLTKPEMMGLFEHTRTVQATLPVIMNSKAIFILVFFIALS